MKIILEMLEEDLYLVRSTLVLAARETTEPIIFRALVEAADQIDKQLYPGRA